jgi:hypothetical protein
MAEQGEDFSDSSSRTKVAGRLIEHREGQVLYLRRCKIYLSVYVTPIRKLNAVIAVRLGTIEKPILAADV